MTRPLIPNRAWFLLAVLTGVLLSGLPLRPLSAQDAPRTLPLGGAAGTRVGEQTAADGGESLSSGSLFFRDDAGRFIALEELGIDEEAVREVLGQFRAGSVAPQFEVTRVAIDGHVVTETARLKVRVEVYVRSDDVWVRVPVGCHEASLVDHEYAGDGQHVFDMDGFTTDRQLRWFLHGKGHHVLTLSMVVPLQIPAHAQRRLRLSLPAAASSHLRVIVPHTEVRAFSTGSPDPATRAVSPDSSEIEMRGLGVDLNVQWEPIQRKPIGNTLLRARTQMLVDFGTQPFSLSARQSIDVVQGDVTEITAQLPTGFRLIHVTTDSTVADSVRIREFHTNEVGKRHQATVRFQEPVAERVVLLWELDPIRSASPGKLTLESIDLEHADDQTGEIEIVAPDGYEINRLDGRDIRRSRVSSSVRPDQIATAFRFLTRSFRMILEVREVEPVYTVTPNLYLTVQEQQLRLDARFLVHIHRGGLTTLQFRWPGFATEDWKLTPGESEAIGQWTITQPDANSLFEFHLPDRTTQDVVVEFHCERPLMDSGKGSDVHLPVAIAARQQPTSLIVSSADNIETRVVPMVGTTTARLTDLQLESLLPSSPAVGQIAGFEVESDELAFVISAESRERRIASTTGVLATIRRNRIEVRQTISLQVEFEELSEIRLTVPDGPEWPIDFRTQDGRLTMIGRGTASRRYLLPKPKIGEFDIVASFVVPLDSSLIGRPKIVSIPLMSCTDAVAGAGTLAIDNSEPGLVSVESDEWSPAFVADHDAAWESANPRSSLTLSLEPNDAVAVRKLTVTKLLVHTVLDIEPRSRATYFLDGEVAEINVILPADAPVDAFWWDDRRLPTPASSPTSGKSVQYRLRISDRPETGEHLLTIDYHSGGQSTPGTLQPGRIPAPRLAGDPWVSESIWRVDLPVGQHLLTLPPAMSPRVEWRWERFFWRRVIPDRTLTQTLIPNSLPQPTMGLGPLAGNSYAFGRNGAAEELEVRAINQSSVMLLGAGLMFALVMLTWPFGRSGLVVMLPLLACVCGIVAIRYPMAVELFIQPALGGLALGGLAIAVDAVARHRFRRDSSLDTIGEYVLPEDPAMPFPPGGIRTEDSTAVRPGPSIGSGRPMQETGSGV